MHRVTTLRMFKRVLPSEGPQESERVFLINAIRDETERLQKAIQRYDHHVACFTRITPLDEACHQATNEVLAALRGKILNAFCTNVRGVYVHRISPRFWQGLSFSQFLLFTDFVFDTAVDGVRPPKVPRNIMGNRIYVRRTTFKRWQGRGRHFISPPRIFEQREIQGYFDRLTREEKKGLNAEHLYARAKGSWITRQQVRALKGMMPLPASRPRKPVKWP